jgi:hypothetical protein
MNDELDIKVGTIINELEILAFTNKPDDTKYKSYGPPWVRCRCSCGKEIIAPLYGIKRGFIKSCGHLKGTSGSAILKKYYEDHDKPTSTYLTINGETRNVSEWSRLSGIPRTTLMYRIKKQYPISKLFDKRILKEETDEKIEE